ncbi:putative methyltransferase C9orf114 isoform X1 [Acanthaster planci]|uniref:28S rRNA (uridine-N(3))-methyltransferase n=1 Tax=Acanthaster planci TaxID=133434 RepID=A0A8B7Z2B5_ACAPL|nr:putative methyltransferase C9orf114 isoform X1 [Acanthaster planci]
MAETLSPKSKKRQTGPMKRPAETSKPKEWKKWRDDNKDKKKKYKDAKLRRQFERQEAKTTAREAGEAREAHVKSKGRTWTVSVALPGSILENAQSPELRTYLAGQIARAMVVFCIDEVIIFDESGMPSETTDGNFDGVGKKGNPNVQLARILQFLECPQYLRKNFFPMHKDLKYAGLLNPLDCPHHLRVDEACPYREGVVLDRAAGQGKGSFVNVGLLKEVRVDRQLQPGLRVTVQMADSDYINSDKKTLRGMVVSPAAPRAEAGLYWGYSVRLASSLGMVFTHSPYKGGYDVTLGTSERGTDVDHVELPKFRHLLIVFGGLKGLEYSLDADEHLKIADPKLLFDHYVNTCPTQGSRTIRTEEAILISLSSLRSKVNQAASQTNQS